MTWHYAIVKTGETYAVHEVYYEDGDELPTSWTNPGDVIGESGEDVISQLKMMLADALYRPSFRVEDDKLVLDYEAEAHRIARETREEISSQLAKMAYDLLEDPEPEHEHEWVDASNELITSGEICLTCNAIRASATGPDWSTTA